MVTLTFYCQDEQSMYKSRDFAAPELRRRKMRCTTERGYPWQAFSFSEPTPFDAEYEMWISIRIDPSDTAALETVRLIAEQTLSLYPGVVRYSLQ